MTTDIIFAIVFILATIIFVVLTIKAEQFDNATYGSEADGCVTRSCAGLAICSALLAVLFAARGWANLYTPKWMWQALLVVTVVSAIVFIVLIVKYRGEDHVQQHHKIFTGFLAALCLIAGLGLYCNGLAFAGTPSVDDDTLAGLTVDPDAVDRSKYDWCSYELLQSSLAPKDSERTSSTGISDALTFSFSSNDKLKEVEEEILRNPVYGVGFVKFFKDLKVGSTTIGKLNPWMDEMLNKDSSFMASSQGVFGWTEYQDASKKVILVTENYRTYAAYLCTLLERFVDKDVQTRQIGENWCLNLTGASKDRAAIKAEYEDYESEAWVLQYVQKDGSIALEFGFNTKDKRYELFRDKVSTSTYATTSSGGGTGGGGDTPTPSPDPTPQKDPTQDPVYQGNANVGGGKNLPTDGTGEYQSTKPERKDYVAPSKSSSSSSSSSSGSGSTSPATDPIPVHGDSHDTEEQSAGDGNGEFSMD